jgi:hypothetical protein
VGDRVEQRVRDQIISSLFLSRKKKYFFSTRNMAHVLILPRHDRLWVKVNALIIVHTYLQKLYVAFELKIAIVYLINEKKYFVTLLFL